MLQSGLVSYNITVVFSQHYNNFLTSIQRHLPTDARHKHCITFNLTRYINVIQCQLIKLLWLLCSLFTGVNTPKSEAKPCKTKSHLCKSHDGQQLQSVLKCNSFKLQQIQYHKNTNDITLFKRNALLHCKQVENLQHVIGFSSV